MRRRCPAAPSILASEALLPVLSDDLLRGLVSFFVVIDPVGNLLIYHVLTQDLDRKGRVAVAAGSTGVAFLTILLFVLGGTAVLDYLNISVSSFQISAGVLLAPSAFRLVEYGQPLNFEQAAEDVTPLQLTVVPLAIPLLAGPGALATAVSFASVLGRAETLVSAGLVLALSAAVFLVGGRIFQLLGPALLRVLSRLVGIALMAIAVDFIVEGLADIFA
ncbi:MAG TPA: MarC family protein [Dehalococcoidia bacterium]